MAYTCFIIGKNTLLIECAEILKQNGFLVKGIISSDEQVHTYCIENDVAYLDVTESFTSILAGTPFDFLFSITNSYLLPPAILRLPRFKTINYHDGPLPAYAGVHATFWAIVNGEKRHGITWHQVDEGIDTGPILIQRQFELSPTETSISLNIKCYSVAVAAFKELVEGLLTDRLSSTPQNPADRSYFGLKKRPDSFINWQCPAIQTVIMHRALDFGFHVSPFGLLKVQIGNDLLFVRELVELTEASDHTDYLPGTVTLCKPDVLGITTSKGWLGLRALTTQSGEPIALGELYQQWGLSVGEVLSPFPSELYEHYQHWDRRCATHQDYWRAKLSRFLPTSVSIPTPYSEDGNRPDKLEQVRLSPAVESAYALLPNTTNRLLTTFLLTIARFNNELSVQVGYSWPTSRQIAADTAGLFMAYLPFAVDFDPESDVEKAISTIEQERTAVEANLSFASDWLLTQPVLKSQTKVVSEADFSIVIYRTSDELEWPVASKSLTLILSDTGNYQIVYDPASWSHGQVTELMHRWEVVLEHLRSQTARPLKTLSLLSPQEQQRVLFDWNAKPVPYPLNQTLVNLFESQVREHPENEALSWGNTLVTYRQLNQRANQLSRYLQQQGVRADTLVGICLERSPEMIVCLLAILKAGGAYVPLDPGYPPTRLAELCAQTDVQLILTQQTWLDRLPTSESTCIVLDQEIPPWLSEEDGDLALPVSADQLAYVLFTSGSSGRPKSVAIPHRGIVRLVKEPNYVRLNSATTMLGLAPLAFDASTFDVWAPLTNGGKLILMTEPQPTLTSIKETIQAHRVNTVFFTTALFNVLVDSDLSTLTSLSQLLTGGEAASSQHLQQAQQQLPDCTITNVYGPTESTTFASYYPLPKTCWDTPSVPIGWPLTNTQLYIVDSFMNLVPVGVTGELLIGGDGLAREYLSQPELTREKFIPNPFDQTPGSRLYRTGDQARYRTDGTIEFVGRLDEQVKIRGFRIEPGEIEYALRQHPAVGEAVVIAATTPAGQKELAAYLVPKAGALIEIKDIRTFVQAHLPPHLIPSAWIPLPALPLTGNGKVAKNRLPSAFVSSADEVTEELTPTEQAIRTLWIAVLKHPVLGKADNFFELGGNSLVAMQVASRIHQQFNRRLTVKDVFDFPTLHQLSRYLDQLPEGPILADDEQIQHTPAQEQDATENIPLSFAQKRLWIIHQLHNLRGTYNVQIILTIHGPLNLLALKQSLEEIVRRHQILRTTFSQSNGIPFQRLNTDLALPFEVIELSEKEPGDKDAWSHWLDDEAYRPFNLEEGPLIRFRVAHRNDDSWVLLMVFHHLVYDGWSTQVLASELSQLYTSLVRRQSHDLPPLSLQYADHVQRQLDQFDSFQVDREVAYWQSRLTGAPIRANLPFDKPAPTVQSFDGADYTFPLADELWDSIRVGIQEPGTTIYLRLLTIFAVWLSRTTNDNDLVIGVPIAGRSQADVADSIGFFVNTLALRINVADESTFRQLLRQVRQWCLDAYAHQDLPFEQVVEALKLPRTLAYSPLVQVMFDYHEDHANDWKLDELVIDTLLTEQKVAKFDLHVSFRETKAGMLITFNYRTDLFSERAVAEMAEGFMEVLKAVVTQPDQQLNDLLNQPTGLSTAITGSLPVVDVIASNSDAGLPLSVVDSPLVNLLRPLWEWLLEVPVIGLDDDFFDSGGHSLLAFQMIAELQRKTGISIPVGSVFAHPTIRSLATHLATTHADLFWESLVAVQPQGNKAPLFLVHPVSGDVGYVYQLAPYLSDDQPLYALRAVGLDGISRPLETIEAMARHYIDLILAKQPDGPYALGGFSLGGVIAYEMAQQLKQMGKDISILALIDSYPVTPSRATSNQVPIAQLLQYYYDVWRTLPKRPSFLFQTVRQKAPFVGGYLLNRLRHSFQRSLPVSDGSVPAELPIQTPIVAISQKAYSMYAFKPYDGKVIFLRAVGHGKPADSSQRISFGWNRYAQGGVDVHALPGDHYSLFKHEETISKIASILTSYLSS